MNRKVMALNVALLILAGIIVWQLRSRWISSQRHIAEVVGQSPAPARVLPPPISEVPKPVSAGEYLDVAQKTLFSRDRNPNVIIEPPPAAPVPPPPPPMPALPFYHGQMGLGLEPVAVLSLKGNDQKGYHSGEMVGPFKLVAFDKEKITLEWDGQQVQKRLVDLRPKEIQAEQPAQVSTPNAPGASAVKSLSAPSAAKPENSAPELGNEMGGGFRGCAVGDNSPAGTVVNGYRKVQSRSLMGTSCYWEQVK